jgi:hypothetical protein
VSIFDVLLILSVGAVEEEAPKSVTPPPSAYSSSAAPTYTNGNTV